MSTTSKHSWSIFLRTSQQRLPQKSLILTRTLFINQNCQRLRHFLRRRKPRLPSYRTSTYSLQTGAALWAASLSILQSALSKSSSTVSHQDHFSTFTPSDLTTRPSLKRAQSTIRRLWSWLLLKSQPLRRIQEAPSFMPLSSRSFLAKRFIKPTPVISFY